MGNFRLRAGLSDLAEVTDIQQPAAAVIKDWFVYLVRAANGALYCGISDDPQRRFIKHQSGKGARFFCSSPAVALVYTELCPSKGDALRRERAIKRLSKAAKEALVEDALAIVTTDEAPSA
ncbi:putative endonuclease [Pseudomonas marincola]|nr:putative endonuclease [Pseudomonas marincola]